MSVVAGSRQARPSLTQRGPWRRWAAVLALLAAGLVTLVPAFSQTLQIAPSGPGDPEPILVRIFSAIERSKLAEALQLTDQLLKEKPNFRLGHLIRGDLLQARAKPLVSFGAVATSTPESQARVRELREEALLRLKAYREKPPKDAVPRYLLQLKSDQKFAVIVDTKKSRLYVYENANGQPRFVADYYISQGKNGPEKWKEGDQKTPVGVYHITRSVPREKLTDFYGAGALPINYPNEWDKRLGRTGHGIWLHGTPPDTFSRAPRATDGCVVLANQDFVSIGRYVQTGMTPVVISEEVEWLKLDDWNRERNSLNVAIERWRRDWESMNIERYLSHYHKDFSGDGNSLTQWSQKKRAVNATKSWIKVGVENISMLRYPGKNDMVVVTFDQNYRSSNLSNTATKKQYWSYGKTGWKIIDESTL